jgi:salicylate hydroxylase
VPKECATFGKHVEALTQLENGRVQIRFKDGSTAEADAVVGCDGIKSQVRLLLLGKDAPAARAQFTGKYAYRGLIPMDKAVDLLGDELARNSQMYFGYHGHMLTFPIERGKTMNVVAFKTSKTGKWEDQRWVVPMKREEMEKDFEDWGQDVKSVLSLMEKTDLWALFDHLPAETYYKGRVCLSGDAAHASTPHQGAGGGMALEDAYMLSGLLGEVKEVDGIEGAFSVYDAIRRERTQRLVITSREGGQMYELEDKDISDDVEKLRHNLDTRQRWIWDHDLKRDMAKAREMMGRHVIRQDKL